MKVHFAGVDKGDYITSLRNLLSKVDVDVVFAHQSFIKNDIPAGEVIHIHWPESYFPNWNVTSKYHLKKYCSALQYFHNRNPILFTLHNRKPHDGNSDIKFKLYSDTINCAKFIHHLGPESIDIVQRDYPDSKNKLHKVIPHHILPIPKEIPTQLVAKKKLSVSKNDMLIFCPGSIRYLTDIQELWSQFENFRNVKNIRLIVHKYRNLLNRYGLFHILQHPYVCYNEFNYRILDKRVSFINQNLSIEELSTYISAADLIFVPRTQNLNSGIPFLTANFDTPLWVQANGNILWSLQKLGYIKVDGNFKPVNTKKVQINNSVMKEMKTLYEMMV